jgi:hypothetical protein
MNQSLTPRAIERIETEILAMRAAAASFEAQDALSRVLDLISEARLADHRAAMQRRAKKLGIKLEANA